MVAVLGEAALVEAAVELEVGGEGEVEVAKMVGGGRGASVGGYGGGEGAGLTGGGRGGGGVHEYVDGNVIVGTGSTGILIRIGSGKLAILLLLPSLFLKPIDVTGVPVEFSFSAALVF